MNRNLSDIHLHQRRNFNKSCLFISSVKGDHRSHLGRTDETRCSCCVAASQHCLLHCSCCGVPHSKGQASAVQVYFLHVYLAKVLHRCQTIDYWPCNYPLHSSIPLTPLEVIRLIHLLHSCLRSNFIGDCSSSHDGLWSPVHFGLRLPLLSSYFIRRCFFVAHRLSGVLKTKC